MLSEEMIAAETKRFRPTYRELGPEEKQHLDMLKSEATTLSCSIQRIGNGVPSREKSLAITKLEESVMWAIKGLTAALLVGVFYFNPPAAFATGTGDNCTGVTVSGCNDITNNTTNNNPTANGGAGGNASNVNAISNTAKIEKGAVDVDTVNLNTNYTKTHVDTDVDVHNSNRQDQHQKQGQDQGQSQAQSVSDAGNSSITWNERRDVAQAFAAGSTFGVRSCGKSAGVGAQGPGFGGSLSLPFGDDVCEGLELADWLSTHGYNDRAVKLLCLKDDDFAEVMGEACK